MSPHDRKKEYLHNTVVPTKIRQTIHLPIAGNEKFPTKSELPQLGWCEIWSFTKDGLDHFWIVGSFELSPNSWICWVGDCFLRIGTGSKSPMTFTTHQFGRIYVWKLFQALKQANPMQIWSLSVIQNQWIQKTDCVEGTKTSKVSRNR